MTSMDLIDDTPIVLDAESEVRKLQELVKKLQQENNILLKRHGSSSGLCSDQSADVENAGMRNIDANCNSSDSDVLYCNGVTPGKTGILREQQLNSTNARLNGNKMGERDVHLDGRDAPVKLTDSVNPSLETVGLIDIDDISLDEEDCWLFKSPQLKTCSKPSNEVPISPSDWLREDFEQPSPELVSARRSLANKLDEVTGISQMEVSKNLIQKFETLKKSTAAMSDRGDVVEILSVQPTGPRGTAKLELLPRQGGLSSVARSPRSSPRSSPQPLGSDSSGENRIGKQQDIQQRQIRVLRASETDGDMVNRHKLEGALKRTSASEENLLSSGGGYRLNDMTDVQQMAKMQEESLRLSFNSPLLARKGLSKSLNRSSGALVVDDHTSVSPESQTPLALSSSLNRSSGSLLQRTRSSAADCKRNKTVATPSFKLDNVARHTSRSTGSLLSPQSEQFATGTNCLPQPAGAGSKAGSPAPIESKMQPGRSLASRMPRNGLQSSIGLGTQKSNVRSSSLHGPRTGVEQEQLSGVRKTSLTKMAAKDAGSSLPGSPCISTQDLHQQPVIAVPNSHRQSLPNLSRGGAAKLSLAQSLRTSDQLLAGSASISAHSPATNNTKQVTPKATTLRQPAKFATSPAVSRNPASPASGSKSRITSVSTGTTGKGNNTSRPTTRLITPSKTRLPSPNARRPLVSAAAVSTNDDSWKDGCF